MCAGGKFQPPLQTGVMRETTGKRWSTGKYSGIPRLIN